MILEEIANTWSSGVHSLLHLGDLNFLPKFKYDGTSKHNHDSESFATLILYTIWAVLYMCYKKLLNSMLRRMQLPFVQRNRIIEGLWYCGFSTCSMVFLTYFVPENVDHSCPWCKTKNLQLGFLIHKTFYLHQATTQIFVHHCWLKGSTIGLFALEIFSPLQQKWPAALVMLLFYEASDLVLLNSCRILLTLYRNQIVRRVAKLLFLLHFLNWIYTHVLLVPGSLISLYVDPIRHWKIHTSLWMWLICETLNSIRNKEFGCLYSKQCLETSLFPPPSKESIEFMNILKKHRNSINNNKLANESNAQKQKTELWQTLFCAMTMKKKLKKLGEKRRVAREENTDVN